MDTRGDFVPKALQLIEEPRKAGDRCCDGAARPGISAKAAARFVSDLEILAHPIRIQLLDVLVKHEGKVCVCDLEAAVPVKQPTVSHHLRLLREAGLIESEKQGLWVYYLVRRAELAALRERITQQLKQLA